MAVKTLAYSAWAIFFLYVGSFFVHFRLDLFDWVKDLRLRSDLVNVHLGARATRQSGRGSECFMFFCARVSMAVTPCLQQRCVQFPQ